MSTKPFGVRNLTVANDVTIGGAVTQNGYSLGFLEAPFNSQNTNYTTVLADSGKSIVHPESDDIGRTFTIANNSSVAYPLGTILTFINLANTITIGINNDTLTVAGSAANNGSRILTKNGIAAAQKVANTKWLISGIGLE